MADHVIASSVVLVGDYNISGDTSKAELTYSAEILDNTCLGDASRSRVAGLLDASLNLTGFWEADTVDAQLDSIVATTGTVITCCPQAGTAGSVAYLMQGMLGEYQPIGAGVGELVQFSAQFQGSEGTAMYRGLVVQPVTAVTGSGNGTGTQLGTAATGIRATVHCTAHSCTSLVVTIESDDNENFTSPTTQLTFATLTATGSELKTATGAVADDYWRITYACTGGATTATVFVALSLY